MGFNTSFGSTGGGGGGVTTFTGLSDTPSSYSGQAGRVVKVNDAEDALIFEDAGGVTPIDIAFDNVAAMVASTEIVTGNTVATYGYHALNDGGQIVYNVTNTDLSADVDGGAVIALANSLYAQAQFPPYYRPEMWGAKGSNSTADADTNVSAFTALFAYMVKDNKPLVFANATYYLNESVPMLNALPLQNNFAAGFYVFEGNGATIRSTGRSTSSTTSLTFNKGVKTLTVASSTQRFQEGEDVCISYRGNRMFAKVLSYSGTTMEVDVYQTDGFQNAVYRSSTVPLEVGTTASINVSGNHQFFAGQIIRIESDYQVSCLANVNSVGSSSINITVTSSDSFVFESTDSKTIGTGNYSFNVNPFQVSRSTVVGCRFRITAVADPTAYMEGVFTGGTSNTNLNITVDVSNGSGTFNDWTIEYLTTPSAMLIGDEGWTGSSWGVRGGITMFDRVVGVRSNTSQTVRPTYVSASASSASLTIATGSLTFTADDPIYAVDMTGYVIAITSPNSGSYAYGIVTAYNTLTGETTANITSVYSAATRTDWQFSFSKTLRNDTASITGSTTTLTLGKGTQNLTVTPYGFDVTGYWVNIMYRSGSSLSNASSYDKCMYGTITAYNDATGAMTVVTVGNNTTDTYSNWVVMANPINPVVSFTLDTPPAGNFANYAVYLNGIQGDYFDQPSSDRKVDVSLNLSGYALSYDDTTGVADVLLTSAYGNRDFTYYTFIFTGQGRDNSFISDRQIGAKFDISDLNFTGQGDTSLDIGLKWSNSYGSSLRRCSFGSLSIGCSALFNLMCSVEDVNYGICAWGLWGSSGDWGNNNTQCNVFYVRNNRFYGSANCLGSSRTTRSNAWTYVKYIHEGQPSRFGIFVDARGDTTVKNFSLDFLHLEVTLLRSFLYVPNGGQINKINFTNNYSQHKNIDYEGSAIIFYNKIYNVNGSIVRPLGNRFAITGNENKFPETLADSYWLKQTVFYTKALSLNSLGQIDVGTGSSFVASSNGVNQGVFSVSSVATLYGTYRTDVGVTGSGIGTTVKGSWGYFRSYVNQGVELVGTSSFGVKIRNEDTRRPFYIQQNGSTLVGSANGRILVQDYVAGTTFYALPIHGGIANNVWKLDTSGSTPLMEWGFVDFLELGDVSDTSYSGLAGAIPTVNSGETGIELVPPSATAGEVLKSTGTTSEYGYIFGQIVSLLNYTTTSSSPIQSGTLRPFGASLNFKATATSMIIEMQVLISVGANETIVAALSSDPTTFTDVGSTEVDLIVNGSSTQGVSAQKTWVVSGLTVGTSYVWYPSFSSTSTGSTVRTGVGISPLIMKAMHGAA